MFTGPTPHHPTYAYMIRCAIESLGEGTGSTVQSISDYIKAKFDGLPPAHDRLILFYLNKLIETGEFALGGAPDRYVVVVNCPSPPAPSARYSSPESVIKCAIRSLDEEGGSTQKSICSYILANFGELPWAPGKFLFFFVSRLVERGEIAAGAGPGRYVLAPPSSGPKSPVAQEGPSKAEERGPSVPRSELRSGDGGGGGGVGDSVSKPKRGRGRPPKKRANASESSPRGAAQEAQDAPRTTQPVGPPPQPNLGPNECVLALPAAATTATAVRVEVKSSK